MVDMIPLLQVSPVSEPIPWGAIIVSMVGAFVVLVGMFKVWFDRRNTATDLALVAANATRIEQQRLEKLVVAPLVAAASTQDYTAQVMYIGKNIDDIAVIRNAFQDHGIANRLIAKLTIESGMEYLADHPGTTLILIMFVESEAEGKVALNLLKGNKETVNIQIIALDGFTDAERVKLFEGGVDGFLSSPFAMAALLLVLTRLGFSSTFARTK